MHSAASNNINVLGPSAPATANVTGQPQQPFFHTPAGPRPSYSQSPASNNPNKPESLNGGDGNQLQVILTIRMLMQGKDVGSIIGKKGDYVRQIREQSGAKINISDGSCPERIVTISGTAAAIDKAFTMVAQKFEDDLQALECSGPKPPITLRLIVPASQCGSLIGKGGSKIREIRDKTGASLQVASEMLSNSTEKPVTISGNSDALMGCMREICQILQDSPAKGPTIQYKPVNQAYNPLAVVSSAAAIAAAAHKTKVAAAAATLPLGIGTLQSGQLGSILPVANPLQNSLELALLQSHNPFVDVSRFLLPNTLSTLAPVASAASVQHQSSAGANAALLTAQASVTAAMNPLAAAGMGNPNGLPLANVYKTTNGLDHLYGLDPSTLATLLAHQQQQQNGLSLTAVDYTTAALLAQLQQQKQQQEHPAHQQAQQQQLIHHQQQQLQLLYQQQQQQQQQGMTGEGKQQQQHQQTGTSSQPMSGRTMGSNGQSVKEMMAADTGTAASQKRYAPY